MSTHRRISSHAIPKSFKMKRGQTLSLAGPVTRLEWDDTLEEDVIVRNFVGWTGVMEIREKRGDKKLIARLNLIWINDVDGLGGFFAKSDVTNEWPEGRYQADTWMTSPGGDKMPSQTINWKIEERVSGYGT